MEYSDWAPHYQRIAEQFGFSLDRERASADRLLALLSTSARAEPLARIAARLSGRVVVVVGLAPDAGPPPLWALPAGSEPLAIVAADGATQTCLAQSLVPEVIVTDLDGPVPSEVSANLRGALVAIHAHGDNRPAIERWTPEFPGELAGSWAGPPERGLFNVGGFTDGDRAAFLAHHVGAKRVILWGFDFTTVSERDPSERQRKLGKLRWAEKLLTILANSGGPPVERWARDGTIRPFS